MATASPTTAASATRRKGGKRPPAESANGPTALSVNEGSGPSSKKLKMELPSTAKAKNKKESEEIAANSIVIKKEKESSGDEQQDKENQNSRQVLAFDWTSEELSQLIGNLTACLPKNDNIKYSTLIEKLDWEKVRFSPYTAAECKEKWIQVMTRLRRFRTLTDMITDAKEWLKHPWSSYSSSKKQKHPEMPKKPLTPYFRYFLEKRQKCSRENPEMSMTDLAKILSKKYQQLTEKKKQKYKENYEKENEVYKQELEKFKREHPDQFPSSEVKHHHNTHEGPLKPQTPFQLFLADRAKKAECADMDKKELTEKSRKVWVTLSEQKRIKWIKKAIQDEHRYTEELCDYTQTHPNFKPETFKSVLSKAEKELKDKSDGKPERPPNSGYSMFSRIMLKQLKDVPSKEKMARISKHWKELSEEERENYNREAQMANEKYREMYASYLKNLPEEERQKLENEVKGGKKKAIVNENAFTDNEEKKLNSNEDNEDMQSRPKKPVSAMMYFQQEKLAAFRQKHSDISKQEAMRHLAREYSELPEKKKEKYKKLAEAARKQNREEALNSKSGHPERSGRKNQLFKGEPRKAPQSGYSLFTTEMLGAITDVDSKSRMAVTAERWQSLPISEKEKYNKRAQELIKKYKKDLEKFLSGLSETEREEYNRVRNRPKGVSKAAAAKLVKEQAPIVKQAPIAKRNIKKEIVSESSDDSSGDDDDDDDDEDDDESGKSGNDSGSGSDESGSDSDDDDDDDDDDNDSDEKNGGNNDSSSGDSSSGESDNESGTSDDSSDSASESED